MVSSTSSPSSPARDAAKMWRAHLAVERGLSKNTLANYTRDLDRYIDWLHNTQAIDDLMDVTTLVVEEYLADLRRGDPDTGRKPLARSSAARALIVARGLHKFALREGLVQTDPAMSVAPPKPPRHLPDVLSVCEVTKLIESISVGPEATPVRIRDRALIELLYGTGARVSEVLALNVDDVSELDGSLMLTGKGNKQRIVPVGEPAHKAIEMYLVRGRPALAKGFSPKLFLNTRGKPMSRQLAWSAIREAAQRAHITATISPHTLRHSYGTHLIQGGADVRVVQELLGHAAVTTTQIYTHITADDVREAFLTAHPRST